MPIFDEETREEIRALLEGLEEPVTLVLFTEPHACEACPQQRQLLEELSALSDRVSLEVKQLAKDTEDARRFSVDKVPATCVVGSTDPGIRFYGLTAGYELASLLEAIRMVSTGESGLGDELESWVRRIDRPAHLEVMVTLTCPYCPRMVHVAHQMALVNEHVRADMVESAEFPELVQRYSVSGVPRTIINGRPSFEGALPAETAILEVLREVSPEAFAALDAELREATGVRRVRAAEPDRRYDVVIVGAGPAGLTAVMYAARKGLDALLVGTRPGGQMRDTAIIENWPGTPSISGDELSLQLLHHVERYPFAEVLGAEVVRVEPDPDGFSIATKTGARYLGRSVVYAAGKQYRRLEVPGEERFLGHGIAFCATCDAPLYQDKRVAIVGGGNSAFTAARDLLGFAREIHIVSFLPGLRADPVLVDEVTRSPKVRLHAGYRVAEFLGQDRLAGLRLEPTSSCDGEGQRLDLLVEGAFLEIGLTPNAGPLETLVETNANHEVVVASDQSTSVPGLFAAGDVTDEPEKQIVVAAGAGARAALAAYRFLTEQRPAASLAPAISTGARGRATPPGPASPRAR